FGWKDVKSFIRHPCTTQAASLRSASAEIVLTAEHSVYHVGRGGLGLSRADEIVVGDRPATDYGHAWEGERERPVDVVAIACQFSGGQVVVDLSGMTREQLGVTARQWQNFHREGIHGTRLPAALYRAHADVLPAPLAVYLSSG